MEEKYLTNEINDKYIMMMLNDFKVSINVHTIDHLSKLAVSFFSMVFDSDILHQNYKKNNNICPYFSNLVYLFHSNNPKRFQEFVDKLVQFEEDMKSFDSIKITNIKVY